jgi:hypothetical protein
MVRRLLAILGGLLATAGFLAGLASLTQPWAGYRAQAAATGAAPQDVSGVVPLLELDRGWWYLDALFALSGLLVGAAMAQPRPARWAGAAAALLGAAGLLLVADLANTLSGGEHTVSTGLARVHVQMSSESGIWFALAAPPLLGLGAAMLSVRRPAQPRDALPN